MHPGVEGRVLERKRNRRCNLTDLGRGEGEEPRLVHNAPPHHREVGVVVGDSLAHPEPCRRLRAIVRVRHEVGRPKALHVPRVKDLVCVQRLDVRSSLAVVDDVHVRAGMLQSRVPLVRRIGDLHHRVVLPGCLAEHVHLHRDHALQRLPRGRASVLRHTARGIGREPHSLPRDRRAIQVETPDEKRVVHELMVTACVVHVSRAGGRKPRDSPECRVGPYRDGGRELRRVALGIHEEIRAVEQCEVRPGPRHCVVERVRGVLEGG